MPAALTPTKTSLEDIPPFPQVAVRLANLLGKDDCDIPTIANLINTDMALAARVLQNANSPLYGRREQQKSVSQAIVLIGLNKVKTIAMSAVTRNYLGIVMKLPEIRACWRHCSACAYLAEDIAHHWGLDAETCYTAGLLHDIGRLAMAVLHGPAYAGFLSHPVEAFDPLDREKEYFGIDHTQAGRQLAANWRLPDEVVVAAGRHHDVLDITEVDSLLVTQTACSLAASFGFRVSHAPQVPAPMVLERLPERLKAKLPTDLDAWRESIEKKVEAAGD